MQSETDFAAIAQTRLIEHLAANEKRHHEILEELPEIVILLNSVGVVQYVNAAWRRLTGGEPSDLRGSRVENFIVQEDREKWVGLIDGTITHEDEQDGSLFRFIGNDSEQLWINARIRRLESGDCVCGLEDLTAQQRLESELMKSQQLESIGRLAGGLAHDFNNFLAIILGNISIAQSKISEGKDIQEELDIAATACTQASCVTKQMLTFSKGGTPVTTELHVTDLVEEVASMALRGTNTRVIFEIDDTIGPIQADRGQLRQVFSSLMANADQAMPMGGDLMVRIKKGILPNSVSESDRANAIVIEMIDNGIGISADDTKAVFDPYFTTKENATGLGLTSAYAIVQRHGGELELESISGVGTTLRISLPYSERSQRDITAESDPLVHRMTNRILVMDDNDLVRGALQAMLSALDYEVVTTADGASCVDAYRESLDIGNRFDLVILDLTVPGGQGGVWSYQRMYELDPYVRAIVISGYGSDEALASPAEYGFKGRLQKPFEIEELQEVINQVMLLSTRRCG